MNLGCVSLSPTTFEKEHLSTNIQPDLGDIQILFLKKGIWIIPSVKTVILDKLNMDLDSKLTALHFV